MSKNKVFDYVVVLKNQNKAVIEKTCWLLGILSFLPISFLLYQDPSSIVNYIFPFIVMSMLVSLYLDKNRNKKLNFFSLLLCIGIGLISLTGNFLLGFLYILAGVSEKFLSGNIEIGFSGDEIVKRGLVSKTYHWSDFNNIVIKDDLLTMDFKNNTLFQAYTDDEEDEEYDVEDDEFNEYCRKRLQLM